MKFKLVEAVTLQHSDYYSSLSVDDQIDVEYRAMEIVERNDIPIFESRVFRPIATEDVSLTRLSNQDLMLFCKHSGYTVLKIKNAQEKDSFIAYLTSYYTKL